jgi:hypothetical protein
MEKPPINEKLHEIEKEVSEFEERYINDEGDPDIDLIQIENWLQFAPYKEKFIRYKKSFIESYIQNRAISKDFERKRRLYNMVRSISYLAVVFSLRYF